MTKKIVNSSKAVLLSLSVAAFLYDSAAPVFAADPAYCRQYARLAVHEASVLSTLAGFRGFDGRWHRNYERHYGWCLTADRGAVAAERDYRRMRLDQCGYQG